MKNFLAIFIRKISGLRQKLFSILLLTSFLTLVIGFLGISSIQAIFDQTQVITKGEMPRISAVHEIVVQFVTADKDFDKILSVEEFSDMAILQAFEANFRHATFRFDMFLSALILGSESPDFMNASNGLLIAEWDRNGFKEKFTIEKADNNLVHLLLETEEYFKYFTQSAQKSISDKKRSLRLLEISEFEEAQQALASAKAHQHDANNFLELANESLDKVTKNSEEIVTTTISDVETFQQQQYVVIVVITLLSFVLSLLLGVLFSSRVIMSPILEMMMVVKDISGGDLSKRVDVRSHDEIGNLGNLFNEMTVKLEELYQDLESKVEKRTEEIRLVNSDFKQKIEELEKFQSLTVDRELKMVSLKKQIREIKGNHTKT